MRLYIIPVAGLLFWVCVAKNVLRLDAERGPRPVDAERGPRPVDALSGPRPVDAESGPHGRIRRMVHEWLQSRSLQSTVYFPICVGIESEGRKEKPILLQVKWNEQDMLQAHGDHLWFYGKNQRIEKSDKCVVIQDLQESDAGVYTFYVTHDDGDGRIIPYPFNLNKNLIRELRNISNFNKNLSPGIFEGPPIKVFFEKTNLALSTIQRLVRVNGTCVDEFSIALLVTWPSIPTTEEPTTTDPESTRPPEHPRNRATLFGAFVFFGVIGVIWVAYFFYCKRYRQES